MLRGVFIDANLLILLVIGRVSTELIKEHRRLRGFSVADYEMLVDFAARYEVIYVTPNTLSETSNLLTSHLRGFRHRFLDTLRIMIEQSREIIVTSADAASNEHYLDLGLTDAALLEVASLETPLLTADVKLFTVATADGVARAVSFWDMRNRNGLDEQA